MIQRVRQVGNHSDLAPLTPHLASCDLPLSAELGPPSITAVRSSYRSEDEMPTLMSGNLIWNNLFHTFTDSTPDKTDKAVKIDILIDKLGFANVSSIFKVQKVQQYAAICSSSDQGEAVGLENFVDGLEVGRSSTSTVAAASRRDALRLGAGVVRAA